MKKPEANMVNQWGPSLAVLALCLWMASNLPAIWVADVYARGAGVLFLLWLLPLLYVVVKFLRLGAWRPDFLLLAFALVACLVGVVGSLNIARHFALGLAIGGQAPANFVKWIWLAGMLAWLPAMGWLAKDIPGNGWPLRCVVLIACMGLSLPWWKGVRA
ncbi:hypothetical protein [Cerasicoccus maritimus]|uniref:hypothetical protein n=1 Tax=Cerasicoccus maritimus TaxID=490089 RepID=UPI002852AB94|nr:hypothetical protein [Cerasicoccus maritimus]